MRRWITAATVISLVLVGTPAAAKVNVAEDTHAEYDACIAEFTKHGLRDLVDQLDKSDNEFVIKKWSYTNTQPDSKSNSTNGKGTGGTTKWDPGDKTPFEGDGVIPDGCSTLYHEMSHLADYDKGTNRKDPCIYSQDGKDVDSGIAAGEVKATRKENVFRAKKGLPPRTHYGKGKQLPPNDKECKPKPPDPPSRGCNVGCAIGAGDPHLKTFDGQRYSFQAVGEFVLTRSTDGDPLEVQGRASALGGLRTVSLFSAAAANVNGDRVGIYRVPTKLNVHIGGKPAEVPIGRTNLPKGGSVERFGGTSVEITWPDGTVLFVQAVGNASIRLNLHIAAGRAGKVDGLFGNFDGTEEADLPFDKLYKEFGESWRVKQAQSLFDYGRGESTETFTDRTFPDKEIRVNDLPNRASAEAICRRAGVTQEQALEACIIDVALTGEVAFAYDAVTTQRLDSTAGTTMLAVAQAGGEARLTFPGTAGQRVFIDVPAANADDDCSPLVVRAPDGDFLGSGCIINGRGYIDTVTLPVNGEYALSFKPDKPGQAWVRVITAIDQEITVTPNGSKVTSVIGQPGAVTRVKFTGKAGQRVYLNVSSSTLPDDCSPLVLRDAKGSFLRSGCVINGRGYVDGELLSADGEYVYLIDPGRDGVGTSELRVTASTDQAGTITVDGPPVTVTITLQGSLARYTFTGTAGQKVAIEATSSTLPDQCSPLELRGPGNDFLGSGCVINGKGSINEEVLPVSGQYTIIVDPERSSAGTSQIRLRSVP